MAGGIRTGAALLGLGPVEWRAGLGAALAVHIGLVTGLALAPSPEAPGPRQPAVLSDETCSNVVGPGCVGACGRPERRPGAAVVPGELAEDASRLLPRRRCPEPMRRYGRWEVEPAPAVAMDLLEAQLVEALGSPDGKLTWRDVEQKQAEKRVDRVKDLIRTPKDGKLTSILGPDKEGAQRKSALGKILGTAHGVRGGDGLVSRKGSAYVRDVRIAVQQRFVLPGNVPPWLRSQLRARVRVTRMSASGQVLAFSIEAKSGNPAFDGTVNGLMLRYKLGVFNLPEPPPHILEEINSRGMVIDLIGGQ